MQETVIKGIQAGNSKLAFVPFTKSTKVDIQKKVETTVSYDSKNTNSQEYEYDQGIN